jgi:hypothetical protein
LAAPDEQGGLKVEEFETKKQLLVLQWKIELLQAAVQDTLDSRQ